MGDRDFDVAGTLLSGTIREIKTLPAFKNS